MSRDTKGDLFSMIGGNLAEGHEILDLMMAAATNPDVVMTEREKCRIFLGRFLFAAATEGLNQARETFPVSQLDVMIDLFIMFGEALASVTVQGFDLSTPRGKRLVRNEVKDKVMLGYDLFVQAIEKANAQEEDKLMPGSPTKAQRSALKWLRNRNGDGVFDKSGVLVAGGERAPVMRATWNHLAAMHMVEFYQDRRRVRVTDFGRRINLSNDEESK